jgi:hypothetical protein
MRTTVRNAIAGTALLGVGVGVGLAAGWAGSTGGDAAAQPAAHASTRVTTPVFHGQLVSYNSCDALLAALRARGRQLVGPYGFSSGGAIVYGSATIYGSATQSLSLRMPAAAAGPALSPLKSGDQQQTLTHSDTNNQVVGVDEPDIVKTDGKLMVSLDGQQLHIVDVRQPRLRSTIALPYPGSEMLLAGDQVVVLSGGSSDQNSSGEGNPVFLQNRYRYGVGTTSTTATIVDVTNPDNPRVARSFTFDAGELAARVINGTIRLVLSSPAPTANWATARNTSGPELARTTKINQSIVDALPLDAWLPHWDSGDGKLLRVSSCDSVAIPSTQAKDAAVGMVTVLSLDPTKATPGAGTSVFGAATTAYAEGAHLYVSDSGTDTRQRFIGTMAPMLPPVKSVVHLLEFDVTNPAQAQFLASGSVNGGLHDSYALSEYQDSLRVTTTTTDASYTTSTGISVLQRRGDKLVQVGQVGGLGTGEQVYAVRYIGDRGYVVTFQQIDPLHVVDLSNPAKPMLSGTLELTGFSTLLQPLPNHQLLGIGRAVTGSSETNSCGGPPGANCGGPIETTDGLQMVLFDVTNAAHPKVLAKQVLTGSYGVDPNSPHTVTADPTTVTDGGYFVMPSTNGLLGLRVTKGRITITTAPFSTPYTVQTGRAVFAGSHVFELGDRGVTVRRSADLKQSGFVSF